MKSKLIPLVVCCLLCAIGLGQWSSPVPLLGGSPYADGQAFVAGAGDTVWATVVSTAPCRVYACWTAGDTWSQPFNLGETINTVKGEEYSPYVSPDGRYFFFMSPRRRADLFAPGEMLTWEKLRRLHDTPGHGNPVVWWVDADFLQALRPKAVK